MARITGDAMTQPAGLECDLSACREIDPGGSLERIMVRGSWAQSMSSPERHVCERCYRELEPLAREGYWRRPISASRLAVRRPRENVNASSGSPSASDEALTGSCLCGAVTFAIDAPLLAAAYCHCTRCQRRTGTAASASALVAPDSLRLLTGEDRLRGYTPQDGNEKIFCSVCGSALFSRNPGAREQMVVRLGALDGDPGIRPSLRQFAAYAAPWEAIPDDGLPRHPERGPI